jgi:tether containing UBX domain for GLUT4
MASHVVVIDTTARRVTVKTTPGKYLSDVLDEACAKLGLDASLYGLK